MLRQRIVSSCRHIPCLAAIGRKRLTEVHMPSLQTRLVVASALALTLTLGAPEASIAQRTKGDEGTGGAPESPPPGAQPGPADAPAAPSTTAPARPEDTGEPPPMPD